MSVFKILSVLSFENPNQFLFMIMKEMVSAVNQHIPYFILRCGTGTGNKAVLPEHLFRDRRYPHISAVNLLEKKQKAGGRA